jgi:hypothetical protein
MPTGWWFPGCLVDVFLVVQSSYTNATCRQPPIWCANCIILSYSPMPTSCIVFCCTIILYQCHMPSAAHMVCRLYNRAIQSNADQLYCVLLYDYLIPMAHAIGSPYGVPTVQYCLYNHLIPMPHAVGSPYGVPTVQYCLYNNLVPMPHAAGCPYGVPTV